MITRTICSLAVVVGVFFTTTAYATDWPMYGADAQRSGYSPDTSQGTLALQWVFTSGQKPNPAWPRRPELQDDRTFQPVVANNTVFFGSSSDNKVYAIDALTGLLKWNFYTEGPIRYAPVVDQGVLYVGSDDGYLYAIDAAGGKLKWRVLGGPQDRRLLGNKRMIGRWPVRGGPVIVDNELIFAAGIWPSEGVYLHAVDPSTGAKKRSRPAFTVINPATFKKINADGTKDPGYGIPLQGYITVAGQDLKCFDGAKTAIFSRKTFDYKGSESASSSWRDTPSPGIMTPNGLVFTRTGTGLTAHKTESDGGKPMRRSGRAEWQFTAEWPITAMIAVGNQLILSCSNAILGIDIKTGKKTWQIEIKGTAYGLAYANNRLLAATEDGNIYCFAEGATDKTATSPTTSTPAINKKIAAAAKEIVAQTGINGGYCLDLGCNDGLLAIALAHLVPNLHICAVAETAENVALARRNIEAAGLYGKIVVYESTIADLPFEEGFADLVISGRTVSGGPAPDANVVEKMMSPCLGKSCIGPPADMKVHQRPAIAGSGNWTHHFADPGNTLCGSDKVVKAPLELAWYQDSDYVMPQRHGSAQRSLYYNGYQILLGLHGIRAINTYNGRTVWEHTIKDLAVGFDIDGLYEIVRATGNMCIDNGQVYLRYSNKCQALDITTGRCAQEFKVPREKESDTPDWWGFIAASDQTLFGSVADDSIRISNFKFAIERNSKTRFHTGSKALFAMDAKSAKHLWTYTAKRSIAHQSIAIGNGKVFLMERLPPGSESTNKPAADYDIGKRARELSKELNTLWWLLEPKLYREKFPRTPGTLIALDSRTGKQLWAKEGVYGNLVMYQPDHDAVVVCGEGRGGADEPGGRMMVCTGKDGTKLWEDEFEQEGARAIINGTRILCEQRHPADGTAKDLLTGKTLPYSYSRAGTKFCGPIMASTHLLAYRAELIGYHSLEPNGKSYIYDGIRPGCGIEIILAGGRVFMSNAAEGCRCKFMQRATICLKPQQEKRGR